MIIASGIGLNKSCWETVCPFLHSTHTHTDVVREASIPEATTENEELLKRLSAYRNTAQELSQGRYLLALHKLEHLQITYAWNPNIFWRSTNKNPSCYFHLRMDTTNTFICSKTSNLWWSDKGERILHTHRKKDK